MLNISIREFEYIITVSQVQSITLAAEKLFISQPALSQAIKRIESELGVQLFRRINGRMKLTDEGRLFVSAGIRINKELRDMTNQMQDISALDGGTLVLGIPHHLGAYIVPEGLAAYQKKYPKISVKLYEAAPSELEKMLSSGHVDLAIIPLPIRNPSICYETFIINKMVLAMNHTNELNQYGYQKPGNPDKMFFNLKKANGASFILAEHGQRIRTASDTVLHHAQISFAEPYSSINVETIKRLVSANLGITLLPELYFVSDNSNSAVNYYYLEPEQDYPWTIVCAYHSNENLTKAAKTFINVLADYYR